MSVVAFKEKSRVLAEQLGLLVRNGSIPLVNGFGPRARSDGIVQRPARFCRRS